MVQGSGKSFCRHSEAPLRFVEQEAHSSPWEKLRKSAEFKEALEKVPAFAERVAGMFKAKLPVAAKAEAPTPPKSTESVA